MYENNINFYPTNLLVNYDFWTRYVKKSQYY